MMIRCRHWASLLAVVALLLAGCSDEYVLMSPKGPVGEHIRNTILLTTGAMLLVVIPTMIMTVVFARKYRHGTKDDKTLYHPDWDHSGKIELFAWGIPILIIAVLATATYITTHSLDPRQPLNDKPPLKIQVVALNWKWLFIYPEEQVAVVNQVAFPVNQPVEFLITSDATMNSFFIPQLGSQLYAMSGMENRLNLMADEAGTYQGISSNYSGYGFAGMRFKALALPQAEYDAWLDKVRAQGSPLTAQAYQALRADSRNNPVTYYNDVNPLLFKNIIDKYVGVKDGFTSHHSD